MGVAMAGSSREGTIQKPGSVKCEETKGESVAGRLQSRGNGF